MSTIELFNVNTNLLKLYNASKEAKHLLNERSRLLKAERPWASNNPLSLQDLAHEVIANHFVVFATLFGTEVFSDVSRQKLIYILPTNLPLQLTSTIIPDGSFWRRSYYDHWNQNDFRLQHRRDSWKNQYMEKFLQTYVENAFPNNVNLVELKEVIDLVKDYIHVLHIEQLQAIEMPARSDCPIKHIDLTYILTSLFNLEELTIRAGVKNAGLRFTEHLFHLTNLDCGNIAKGLQKSLNLKKFKIHQTPLDELKLRTIMSPLSSLQLLKHLEFTSCDISCDSFTSLVNTVASCVSLKTLILTNNKIGARGSVSLASILPQLKLQTLDLRLNFIRDIGARALFSCLQTHSTLKKLELSGCQITSKSIDDLVALIKTNRQLWEIHLNCNDFEKLTESSIIGALKTNSILRVLHLKMSGVSNRSKELIDDALRE